MKQRPELFSKTNQEINEPSYEMVGVKITVTKYGQNNRIFDIFFLVDFLFTNALYSGKKIHILGHRKTMTSVVPDPSGVTLRKNCVYIDLCHTPNRESRS